jgi:hypothetical protein
MPKGTKTHKIYDARVKKGASKGKAARIAQAKTGKSLATGGSRSGAIATSGPSRSVHSLISYCSCIFRSLEAHFFSGGL